VTVTLDIRLAQLGYFKVGSSQQQSHRVKKEFPRSDFGHGFRCGHQHLAPRIGEGLTPRRLENVALDGLPLHVVRGVRGFYLLWVSS
jgi:hypothetical protein